MDIEVIRASKQLGIPENEIKDRYIGYFGWEEADEDFNFSYNFNKNDFQCGIYNTLKTLEYYAYCNAKESGELDNVPRKFIRHIDWSILLLTSTIRVISCMMVMSLGQSD